eukprot:3584863-Karenia_brevis.AAC.1
MACAPTTQASPRCWYISTSSGACCVVAFTGQHYCGSGRPFRILLAQLLGAFFHSQTGDIFLPVPIH